MRKYLACLIAGTLAVTLSAFAPSTAATQDSGRNDATASAPVADFSAPGAAGMAPSLEAHPGIWFAIRIAIAATGRHATTVVVRRTTYEAAKRAAVKMAVKELAKTAEELTVSGGARLLKLNRRNFRENVRRRINWSKASLKGYDVHHTMPVKFEDRFKEAGLNIHNPVYGHPWCARPHRAAAAAFNRKWGRWLKGKDIEDTNKWREKIESKRLKMVSNATWSATYQCQ